MFQKHEKQSLGPGTSVKKLSVMVHTCNVSAVEAEIGRASLPSLLGKDESLKPPLWLTRHYPSTATAHKLAQNNLGW